jgi:c-di-GMP-specific phosphodiesterase
VIAEGIETLEQAEKLSRLDCRMAQGYFYSRPVTADVVGGLLDRSLPVLALASA